MYGKVSARHGRFQTWHGNTTLAPQKPDISLLSASDFLHELLKDDCVHLVIPFARFHNSVLQRETPDPRTMAILTQRQTHVDRSN
jgi:hypothetical protein